ncbi:IS630 family transposase [Aquimarina sp. ERC-38]|uniref:IS630 family transposase n=1 Tax=Aquimarina sp. ERC-38 TaxID=2949996 RepID=UPI0022471546|nr:IS630 family transposase [Aquimarina sp. ERC-38]UZO79419.1 IS630 family transposase [Aquimarina sp. ERC-38]
MSQLIFQLKIFRYEFVEKRPIVYLDESGFAFDAPRNHGYSQKGQRCYAGKDWHARGRVNAIGAITNFRLFNVCLFDGTINADVFYAWVTQELLPNTPKKAVIVLDNATFHKRNDAIQAIDKQGHTLEFLPPYSPQLNPIEKKWAQAKSIRRKFNYTPEQLFIYAKL